MAVVYIIIAMNGDQDTSLERNLPPTLFYIKLTPRQFQLLQSKLPTLYSLQRAHGRPSTKSSALSNLPLKSKSRKMSTEDKPNCRKQSTRHTPVHSEMASRSMTTNGDGALTSKMLHFIEMVSLDPCLSKHYEGEVQKVATAIKIGELTQYSAFLSEMDKIVNKTRVGKPATKAKLVFARMYRSVFPVNNRLQRVAQHETDTQDSSTPLEHTFKIMSKKMGKKRDDEHPPLKDRPASSSIDQSTQSNTGLKTPSKEANLPYSDCERLWNFYCFLLETDQEKLLKECQLASLEVVTLLRMSKKELAVFKGVLKKYLSRYGKSLDDEWGKEAEESSFEIEDEE